MANGSEDGSHALQKLVDDLRAHQLELEAQNEQLRTAQSALEASRARYVDLYDFAPVGYVSVNARGRIHEINLTAAQLLGEPVANLIGQDFSRLLAREETQRFRDHLGECLATGTAGTLEVQLHTASGATRQVRLHTAAFPSPDGQRLCRLAISDVTDRVELQLRLELSERMACLGRLSASVAHEVNNPLGFLVSSLELARRATRAQGIEDRALLAALEDADAAAQRIGGIVRSLRQLTRPDDHPDAAVDVGGAVEAALQVAAPLLTHRGRLAKTVSPSLPRALGDPGQVIQVVLNLLVNAADAIAADGGPSPEVSVRAWSEGPRITVEVQDTGPGVAEEDRERIFDPFFSSKTPEAGLGLGLAISRNLASLMGGELHLVPTPERRGATFRLLLRAAPGDWVEPAAGVERAAASSPRRLRLLVIDDDLQFGRSLSLLLAPNHDVEVVSRGADAVARVAERPFDALLCDVMMPDMSGWDVYVAVTRADPTLSQRFLFMTGGAFAEGTRALVDGSGVPQLLKPFREEQLLRALRGLTERSGASPVQSGSRSEESSGGHGTRQEHPTRQEHVTSRLELASTPGQRG